MLYNILYEFLYPLNPYWSALRALNVFRYITVRTAFSGLTALVLSLAMGPWLIDRLRAFQIAQHIREEGPQSHKAKAGTPTMGGILIVLAIVIPTLLWTDLRNPFMWIVVGSTLSFGAVGFADDYLKVVNKRN